MQELIATSRRVATRQLKYRCMECNQPILKGQEYERVTQKWDGEIQSNCSHVECSDFSCKIHRETSRTGISLLEPDDCYGRKWMWLAINDCHDTRRDILKLSKTNPFVRRNVLTSLWEMRKKHKPPL